MPEVGIPSYTFLANFIQACIFILFIFSPLPTAPIVTSHYDRLRNVHNITTRNKTLYILIPAAETAVTITFPVLVGRCAIKLKLSDS